MAKKKKETETNVASYSSPIPTPTPHTNTCIPTVTEVVGMLGTWPGQGCVSDTVGLV